MTKIILQKYNQTINFHKSNAGLDNTLLINVLRILLIFQNSETVSNHSKREKSNHVKQLLKQRHHLDQGDIV